MARPSRERPISEALQLRGKAQEIMRRIDTPEKAAEFYVNTQEAYGAAGEIMSHVKSMLMLDAKERPIQVGASFVSAEPYQYTYDVAAVKELAPDCIVAKEVPTSDKMQRINELAVRLLEFGLKPDPESLEADSNDVAEIVKLSMPQTVEAVDANKLRAVLGRGGKLAEQLIARRVKQATSWKLVIKEGANANS